jgi:signal recognition particle subunit SRP54
MKRVEAMVLSMTPRERAVPHLIDGSRRLRIANGSGATVQQVNQLLEGRKMMEKMMKSVGKNAAGVPGGLPGLPGAAVAPPKTGLTPAPGSRGRKPKKKSSRR